MIPYRRKDASAGGFGIVYPIYHPQVGFGYAVSERSFFGGFIFVNIIKYPVCEGDDKSQMLCNSTEIADAVQNFGSMLEKTGDLVYNYNTDNYARSIHYGER